MMKKRFDKKDRPRRGIYILPNIFTSMTIFCGFYAIIAAIDPDY
jgi:CDP-diacylglycerol---serine O-phosphatidyltransferase